MAKKEDPVQTIEVRDGDEIMHVAYGVCTQKCGEIHSVSAPRDRQARVGLHQSFAICDGVPTQHENIQPQPLTITA